MKKLAGFCVGTAILASSLVPNLQAQTAPSGHVDFGKFSAPAAGGQFVEVNLSSNIIAMVARLGKEAEPQIANVLAGLRSIRVNVIGLDDQNRPELEKHFASIRSDLDTQSWERVVTAQMDNVDVSVHLRTTGSEAIRGLVVTVIENHKQAVLVNIDGDIKLEDVEMIGERFNVEPLKKVGVMLKKH
jgi:hypothetical protein